MDKREIFDSLDKFSQQLMLTLAEVEAIKKEIQGLVGENTSLRLENSKLRERLSQISLNEQEASQQHGHGLSNLEKIYDDGFHVCTFFYGQRREDDEACAFCLELLYREE